MDNEYGPVYELTGFAALSEKARIELDEEIRRYLSIRYVFIMGRLSDGRVDIFRNRGAGYPDLRLERAADGRILVCNMGGKGRWGAFAMLRQVLRRFPGMGIDQVLDAAS